MMPKTPREFYSELGAGWLSQRKSESQTSMELEYLSRLLRRDWKILDLACGYGRLAIPLALEGYRVEGMDITPAFVERAREDAARKGLNIGFRIGSMIDLPYYDGSFHSVICMWNAFSEIAEEQDQPRAILEIYRVLKKGGMAFIEMRNHRSSGLEVNNVIDGQEAMPSYRHTRGSMKRLMGICGIENFRVFIDNFGGRNRLLVEMHRTT